jgi:hypothetical protein
MTEMSITANQKKSDIHRFSWNVENFDKVKLSPKPEANKGGDVEGTNFVVTLEPLEIRTFFVRFQNQNK